MRTLDLITDIHAGNYHASQLDDRKRAVTRPSFDPECRSLVRSAKGDKDQDLPFPNLHV